MGKTKFQVGDYVRLTSKGVRHFASFNDEADLSGDLSGQVIYIHPDPGALYGVRFDGYGDYDDSDIQDYHLVPTSDHIEQAIKEEDIDAAIQSIMAAFHG